MIVLRTTTQKAKKEHICDYCQCKIKVGESYIYQANVAYCDFHVWKSHINCSYIADKLNMFDECDEGLDGDSFCEYIKGEYDNLMPDNLEIDFVNKLNYVVNHYLKIK